MVKNATASAALRLARAGLELRAAETARRELPFWALARRWRAGGDVWAARAELTLARTLLLRHTPRKATR